MMPFKRTTQKGRVVERFNYLLKQFGYYNQSIFPNNLFDEEELIILSRRRYEFDIKKGNRLLLECVISPNIIEPFYSTLKSVGRSEDDIDPANDHDSNLKAPVNNRKEKWEKLLKLQIEKMDEIVCFEMNKRPKHERDILILYFFDDEKEYRIHKELGVSRYTVDKIIQEVVDIIRNNVPRDLEGFERKSCGM